MIILQTCTYEISATFDNGKTWVRHRPRTLDGVKRIYRKYINKHAKCLTAQITQSTRVILHEYCKIR